MKRLFCVVLSLFLFCAVADAAVQIQLRRDTASNWTSNNPTLASGEYGYEYDTKKNKIGDGSTAWNSLPYQTPWIVNNNDIYSSNSGNVGIGTTTPGFTLDVDGAINATALYVNGSPFSSGASATEISFTNASLSAGVLTVTHNKGLTSGYTAMVTIVDNTGNVIIPDAINTFTTNSFKVDLTSYGTLIGTWYCLYITK